MDARLLLVAKAARGKMCAGASMRRALQVATSDDAEQSVAGALQAQLWSGRPPSPGPLVTCRRAGSGCAPCRWRSQTRPSGRSQTQSLRTLQAGKRSEGERRVRPRPLAALWVSVRRGWQLADSIARWQSVRCATHVAWGSSAPCCVSPACHLGSSSSGMNAVGSGGRRSSGRSPKNIHTKPPLSTTG